MATNTDRTDNSNNNTSTTQPRKQASSSNNSEGVMHQRIFSNMNVSTKIKQGGPMMSKIIQNAVNKRVGNSMYKGSYEGTI